MRVLIASTVLCLLVACTSTPRKAPVASQPTSTLAPIDQARANNQHWKATDLIAAFPPSADSNYRPPARLAVLLPQSGSLAIAGNAIRDGLLAGYYAETRVKPTIRFYDSKGTANGATAAYQMAINDGAQMIIGLIGKDEVQAISATTLSIPVLALNTGDAQNNKMLLNFSLGPEREGELLAKQLLSKKYLKVIVFSTSSESNSRIISSMQKHYSAGGGSILADAPTPRIITDETTGAVTSPKLPDSLLQAQAIVLLMHGSDAKTTRAALALNGASAIPLLSSVDIFEIKDEKTNTQLDGITFLQMPWLLGRHNAASVSISQLKPLPSARSLSGSRLNAFGIDSWLISTHLQAWLNNPNGTLNGATGNLHLEPNGTIERDLPWSVYSNGFPIPADGNQP
jgi:outer membrane PBP1 activator LpoA protein